MIVLLSDIGFWLILFWVLGAAVLCYLMALKRRRSTLLWLIIGLILGWIGVLILYFLPKLPPKKYKIEKPDKFDSKLKMYQTLNDMREEKKKNEKQFKHEH
jgi:apolipoprotein N-acyltransferase